MAVTSEFLDCFSRPRREITRYTQAPYLPMCSGVFLQTNIGACEYIFCTNSDVSQRLNSWHEHEDAGTGILLHDATGFKHRRPSFSI